MGVQYFYLLDLAAPGTPDPLQNHFGAAKFIRGHLAPVFYYTEEKRLRSQHFPVFLTGNKVGFKAFAELPLLIPQQVFI